MAFCLLMVGGTCPQFTPTERILKGAWISCCWSPMRLEKQKRLGFGPFLEWKGQGLWLTSYSDNGTRKDSMVAVCGSHGPSGAINAWMFCLSQMEPSREGSCPSLEGTYKGVCQKGHLERQWGSKRRVSVEKTPKNQVMRGRFKAICGRDFAFTGASQRCQH